MENKMDMGVESFQGLGCMVKGFGEGFWSVGLGLDYGRGSEVKLSGSIADLTTFLPCRFEICPAPSSRIQGLGV